MKRKIIAGMVLFVMCISMCMTCFAVSFSDLSEEHWAYEYITTLADKGVVNGYPDGTFQPGKPVTKAEFLKLVVECVDTDLVNNDNIKFFENLEYTNWYEKYYMLASLYRIMPGGYNTGSPNEEATREQMVNVLYLYGVNYTLFDNIELKLSPNAIEALKEIAYEMKYTKKNNLSDKEFEKAYQKLSNKQKSDLRKAYKKSFENEEFYLLEEVENYTDVKELPYSEKVKLEYLIKSGLLKGYEDNTFRLENTLTRAETSTIIYRILNNGGNKNEK